MKLCKWQAKRLLKSRRRIKWSLISVDSIRTLLARHYHTVCIPFARHLHAFNALFARHLHTFHALFARQTHAIRLLFAQASVVSLGLGTVRRFSQVQIEFRSFAASQEKSGHGQEKIRRQGDGALSPSVSVSLRYRLSVSPSLPI